MSFNPPTPHRPPARAARTTSRSRFAVLLVGPFLALAAADGELDVAHGLYRREEYRLAVDEYRKAMAPGLPPPVEHEARFFLAECLRQSGDDRTALAELERLAGAVPVDHPYAAMTLFRTGQLGVKLGQSAAAGAALARFLKQYPGHELQASAAYFLAESLLNQGKPTEAGRALDVADAAKPPPPLADRVSLARGRIAEAAGRFDDAAQWYRSVAERQPAVAAAPDALFALGAVLRSQRKPAEAQVCFEQIVQAHPGHRRTGDAALQAAGCLVDQKKPSDAVLALTKLLAAVSDDPLFAVDVRLQLAAARSAAGDK
ncbi:MAG: tetratricopeptide repeat protein, partial [Planctomycetia bacterium]